MEDKKLKILGKLKEKKQINYSRDYRYLGKGRMNCFIQFFLGMIPVVYAYLMFHNKIAYYMAKYANEFIKKMHDAGVSNDEIIKLVQEAIGEN